jgi:hypothetical protein
MVKCFQHLRGHYFFYRLLLLFCQTPPPRARHFSSSVRRSSFSLFASQYSSIGHCSSSADRCSSSVRRSLLLLRASVVAAPPPPVATPPPRADRCSKSWCSYSMEGMVNASHRRSSSEPPPLPTVGQAHPHRRVDIVLAVGLARPPVLPTSVPLSPPPCVTATTTKTDAEEERKYVSIHIPPSHPGLCAPACTHF